MTAMNPNISRADLMRTIARDLDRHGWDWAIGTPGHPAPAAQCDFLCRHPHDGRILALEVVAHRHWITRPRIEMMRAWHQADATPLLVRPDNYDLLMYLLERPHREGVDMSLHRAVS